MKILIDADIIKYRCGFAGEKTRYEFWLDSDVTATEDPDSGEMLYQTDEGVEPLFVAENAKEGKAWLETQDDPSVVTRIPRKHIDPIEHVLHSTKLVMQTIQGKYPDGTPVLYFSCSTPDNWRTQFYPEYKANRPDRKPHYAADIDAYLKARWEWIMQDTYEADDMIAAEAFKLGLQGKPCVTVTIDKDMDQIPGLHYHWVKDEEYTMSAQEAAQCLAKQCLSGDMTDNIPGLPGIGPKKAEDYLLSADGDSLGEIVLGKYKEHYVNEAQARYEACLTTALVSLPTTEAHRQRLEEAVENARIDFEASAEDSAQPA